MMKKQNDSQVNFIKTSAIKDAQDYFEQTQRIANSLGKQEALYSNSLFNQTQYINKLFFEQNEKFANLSKEIKKMQIDPLADYAKEIKRMQVDPLANLGKEIIQHYNERNKKFLEMVEESQKIYAILNGDLVSKAIHSITEYYFKQEQIVKKLVDSANKFRNINYIPYRMALKRWGIWGWTIPIFFDLDIDFFSNLPKSFFKARQLIKGNISDKQFKKFLGSVSVDFKDNNKVKDAIWCYKNKKYRVCALSIFSAIDEILLSHQEIKPKQKRHALTEIKKMKEDMSKIKIFAFRHIMFFNLAEALCVVYANAKDFSIEENTINRNMVMHGMNKYKIGKLECWQLFFLLTNLNQFWVNGFLKEAKEN